jgi:hypothetical protein
MFDPTQFSDIYDLIDLSSSDSWPNAPFQVEPSQALQYIS